MTPGPINFRGPTGFGKAVGFSELERGPNEMKLRNQHMKPEDFFFFWRSLNFDRKNRYNFGEDLFLFFEIT